MGCCPPPVNNAQMRCMPMFSTIIWCALYYEYNMTLYYISQHTARVLRSYKYKVFIFVYMLHLNST